MNRFIKVRIKNCKLSIEGVASLAKQMMLKEGDEKGFEMEEVTRRKVTLSWFERIVVSRTVDGRVFGSTTFEEVKIITFHLVFLGTAENLILVNPPQGRHRVHSVLRSIFPTDNFVFLPIDVKKSGTKIAAKRGVSVIGIETESSPVDKDVSLSMTLAGYGDLTGYLEGKYPKYSEKYRALHLEIPMRSGGTTRATLSASGIVRFSDEVSFRDIEDIAELLVHD